jgi:hypothetical protein
VLEPSPPAVDEEPWCADDPTDRGDVPPGRQVVSPVSTGDLTWQELVDGDGLLSTWCCERWLASYRALEPAPETLVETRVALHRVAEHVISPARQRANGKIGLRWTLGGFGTPFFGADAQVRAENGVLVVQSRFRERRAPITTLAAAAELIGFDLNGDETEVAAAPLTVDPDAARFIGNFLGFATNVLEQLRADVPPDYEPGRVELWPHSFDLVVEIGMEQAGRRAAFGASLGDLYHEAPYLFVTPLDVRPTGELWQAWSFSGAELTYRELRAAPDERACALDFLRSRVEALHHPLLPR